MGKDVMLGDGAGIGWDHGGPRSLPGREPRTAVELVEVLDDMRAGLGDPERMDSARARAIYRLDQSRLRAAVRDRR